MSWGKHRKVKFFSIPIEKEVTKIEKDGKVGVVNTSLQNRIY